MKRGRELEIKIRMEKDEEMMELRGEEARKMLVCLDERRNKEKMLKRERTCDKDRDKER